eukprot:gnl/TRDRNA2_/TRDRNA2_30580_c0_seq1.p1 gnl/TRDRNA2_/TRDRNA2_30580_c0~~gnl/TRDRNA2_/TRDRNA2_30580_c0_seq1.p1  ORF type:complete len:254 (-),score=28.58 gnl/TRDRNA2_/TRDRNA2_30580_c0_seq1:59-781(-)
MADDGVLPAAMAGEPPSTAPSSPTAEVSGLSRPHTSPTAKASSTTDALATGPMLQRALKDVPAVRGKSPGTISRFAKPAVSSPAKRPISTPNAWRFMGADEIEHDKFAVHNHVVGKIKDQLNYEFPITSWHCSEWSEGVRRIASAPSLTLTDFPTVGPSSPMAAAPRSSPPPRAARSMKLAAVSLGGRGPDGRMLPGEGEGVDGGRHSPGGAWASARGWAIKAQGRELMQVGSTSKSSQS